MARDTCATREEVESWFDAEGRLIEEAAMRRTLFEGKTLYRSSYESVY